MNNGSCVKRYDIALLLLRVIVGVVFIAHGSQKLFGAFGGPGIEGFTAFLTKLNVPAPQVSAWMAAVSEFGGGILVLIGLGTRLGAIALICTMGVAIATVHYKAFFVSNGGMEYALTLGVINLALLIAGGGRLSVAGLMRGECCSKKA